MRGRASGIDTSSVAAGYGKWASMTELRVRLLSAPVSGDGTLDEVLVVDPARERAWSLGSSTVATGMQKWMGTDALEF